MAKQGSLSKKLKKEQELMVSKSLQKDMTSPDVLPEKNSQSEEKGENL